MTVEPATLWHVSPSPIAPGQALNSYQPDAGYLFMVRQAIDNGIPFLETLLQADVMTSAKTRTGVVLPSFLIEVIFEKVRAEDFPERPSRVGSVHLFRDVEAARRFNTQFRAGRAGIYEVRREAGDMFASFMDWVTPGIELQVPVTEQLDQMRARARGYWRGDASTPADYPEALVTGRVVITRLVG